MNNKKISLDHALEFILNGDDRELESLSEDSDAEDFDVSALVTDDLENTVWWSITDRKRNEWWWKLKWWGTTTTYKTKQSIKTNQEKLFLGEKEFSKDR